VLAEVLDGFSPEELTAELVGKVGFRCSAPPRTSHHGHRRTRRLHCPHHRLPPPPTPPHPQVLKTANRKGKQLWLEVQDARCLLIHLGMTGSLVVEGVEAAKYVK